MICDNCADLDLRKALEGTHLAAYGCAASKRNPLKAWVWRFSENCDFCQFWLACVGKRQNTEYPLRCLKLAPRTLFTSQYENPERIFRLVRNYGPDYEPASWPIVLIGRTIGCEAQNAILSNRGFRVVPPKIQYNMFKLVNERLQCCRETHEECNARFQVAVSPVTGLRVIDCRYRRIVSAPEGCQYVALSYVWGNEKHPKHLDNTRLSSLPQTIEDAISVTLRLRFRYLWVDMYCIKQDDMEDFHIQIRQMDRVYRGAEVTIVAAAGTGPSRGLPGISSVRQEKHAHGFLDQLQIAKLFNQPWDNVKHSQWFSRGWTYQESLFSKRRLFFTKAEIIFDCMQEWSSENAPCQTKNIKSEDVEYIQQPPDFWTDRQLESQVYHLINEYSMRKLTFAHDILNAFSGTLRAFQRLNNPVQNHWGIPLPQTPNNWLSCFLLGLAWKFHHLSDSVCRINDFPSWSWCGWENPHPYTPGSLFNTSSHPISETTVSVELADGSILPWTDFCQEVTKRPTHTWTSRFIWINTWFVQFTINEFTQREHIWCGLFGHEAVTETADGRQLEWHANVVHFGECVGISLGVSAGLLLLITERDGYWERIGTVCLGDYCRDSPLAWLYSQKGEDWETARLPLKRERRSFRLG